MGNCCGGEEKNKRSALTSSSDVEDTTTSGPGSSYHDPSQHHSDGVGGDSSHVHDGSRSGTPGAGTPGLDAQSDQDLARAAEAERHRALREEQARLELIVSAAGRDMVPVGRRDNAFDPAYAAAVHAEITGRGGAVTDGSIPGSVNDALIHKPVRGKLPKSALPRPRVDSSAVIDMLSRSRWEGIELGKRGGHGGCGGEDPNYFFDDVAESFLDACVQTRAKLFAGTMPIVENLP